jgi:GNAT superfamily N-acetyltransferase
MRHITESFQPITVTAALLPQAQALSDEAGWNQNADDWQVFLRHGEIFGVQAGEQLVATAAILPYGADFAWISMVLVTAEFRRRGLAKALMQQCLERLHAQHRMALLDATEAGEPVYRALGFATLARMTRWSGPGGAPPGRRALPAAWAPVLPLPQAEGEYGFHEHRRLAGAPNPLPQAEWEYGPCDAAAFGADRSFLLDDFLARAGAGVWSDGENAAVLRPGRHAWQIGPVIGTPGGATSLLQQAIDAAPGPVVIDVLDAGAGLTAALAQRGFSARRGFCRMALGRTTLPGIPARMLAAAGPEFG